MARSMRYLRPASAVAAVLFLVSPLTADDWPNWLGPQNDGVWRESGIVQEIPEDGLTVTWRVPISGGYSGAAIASGLLYVMDFVEDEKTPEASDSAASPQTRPRGRQGKERVHCLDAQTGTSVWNHEYATSLDVSYPGGPRTSPVVDGERVYCLGTMGQLFCFDAKNGNIVWQQNLAEAFSTKPPIWGFAANPLVIEGQLICLVGGEGSGVVSLDKMTGELNWKNITAQEIGYAPPVLASINGIQQLVVWYDVAVVGLNPADGKQIWSHKFPQAKPQRPVVSIVPPHVADNTIFLSNYYHGSTRVKVTNSDTQELWTTEKNKGHRDDINSIMSTIVLNEGCYFGVAGNGELRCVDTESGELVWRSYQSLATKDEDPKVMPRGMTGFASMFITPQDDKYWLFTDQGELILADLTRAAYQEFGRTSLLKTTGSTRGRPYVWCPPAFADGHLFVRNEEELICVDMREATYQ